MAAEVSDKLADIDQALQYVTHLYLEFVNGALKNDAQYTEHRNREEWVIYELQSRKLSRLFESLPGFVVDALGVMNPELPTRAVVEPDEQ